MLRTPAALTLSVLAALAGVPAGAALAGDAPAPVASPAVVSDKDAAAALDTFATAFKGQKPAVQLKLLANLALVRHSRVSDRLADLGEDDDVHGEVRARCFELLAPRGAGEKAIGVRVGRFVAKRSEAAQKALGKGDFGVPVDARTMEVKKDTPEVKAALEAGRLNAVATAAALRCAAGLGWRPREASEAMEPFLQCAYDELAVAALDTLAGWKEEEALPALLKLFRMYPKENRWETGSSLDRAGNNASAQRSWMTYFGHPLKQRARPAVHRALEAAFEAITGRRFDTPDHLDLWMRDREARPGSRK